MNVQIPVWVIKAFYILPEIALFFAMSTLLKKPIYSGTLKRDIFGFFWAFLIMAWAGSFNDTFGVIRAGFTAIFN